MSNAQRASMGANDWAAKRKEQMDRAKQLRDERKAGAPSQNNALKTMGQDIVRGGSNNGRSQQHTPHSQHNPTGDMSVLSSPSLAQMSSHSGHYNSQTY